MRDWQLDAIPAETLLDLIQTAVALVPNRAHSDGADLPLYQSCDQLGTKVPFDRPPEGNK